MSTVPRTLVVTGSLMAMGIAAHTAVNLRRLRRPAPRAQAALPIHERVSVLMPARDEATTIASAITSVSSQVTAYGADEIDVEIVVLDDGSSDGTDALARAAAASDPRVRVISGPDDPPPPGWLGKTWACARLAQHATGTALAFMDADVELEPAAVLSLVTELRGSGFAMVAPYPHQDARSWLERLVQPLVTWSWVATLSLRWAERTTRPSLSAANGQLIMVDTAAYRRVGGHASVAGEVIEDVALMRAFKRMGYRTTTVDGSHLARCRMYTSPREVVDGYTKSLWAAFNGPAGSVAVTVLLIGAFVVPGIAMIAAPKGSTRRIATAGYLAGVTSRALVAHRTGERVVPDALAHPASVAAFAALTTMSWSRHLRGTNSWKGRPV